MKKCKENNPQYSTYNAEGGEILDPRPCAIPVGYKRPPTLAEVVQRLIRSNAVQAQMANSGVESFDEANDFDTGNEEEYLPDSQYEIRLLDGETAPLASQGTTPFKEQEMVKPEPKTEVKPQE